MELQVEDAARTRNLLAPLLAWKFTFIAVVILCRLLLPNFFSVRNYAANFHWPPDKQPGLIEQFTTWDGEHYLFLAQYGYIPHARSLAFYPLWPGILAIAGRLFAGHYWLAGLILANMCSVLAWLLFHRLVALERDSETADWATAFLIAFPGALFFQLPYTESLFLLLVMLLFHGMQKGNDWLIAAAGFFLPLTRVIGLLCLAPVALFYWRQRRVSIAALAAIPLGFAAYLLTFHFATGSASAGFAAQRHFVAQAGIEKLFNVVGFLRSLPPGQPHGLFDSAVDRFLFVLLLAALVPIWRINRTWLAYALVAGVFPAIANSFMAYTRYLAVVFPLFVVAATVLGGPRRRAWRMVVLAASLALQIVFTLRHVNFYWAG